MFFKDYLKVSALLLALFLTILAPGCASDSDSCNQTLSDVSALEKAANGRLKTMDIANPDEFFYAQAEASKKQYYDALLILTSGCAGDGINYVQYKNMVRSLELKYAFLDLCVRFGETEETVSTMLSKSYPDFQKELKETMVNLENQRYEAKRLQVMAGEIDTSVLDPENQNMVGIIEQDTAVVLSKIDQYLTLLVPYQ
ncbi:MAG: hypothetical protein JXQ82_08230 [Methanomicrobiaceae archaeon]|nr:hypothetical protein [Methanomicrobiaceae archaeon]